MDPKMSNLPRDLEEEILARIPLTSLRKVRSTCKKWNTLSKCKSFAKKHLGQAKLAAAKEFLVVMMMDFNVYLMRVNLHNNNFESCIKLEGKVISLDALDQIDDLYRVFHCDGLLLCISKDNTMLMVWNPYWGQTWWIKPTLDVRRYERYIYALGYKKSSSKSHKILKFNIDYDINNFVEVKIYDLNSNSNSWRVLDITSEWRIDYNDSGISLKGNTYWFVRDKGEGKDSFLVCFDFTRERFGPHLPLLFEPLPEDTVSLSSVREEQLVVLFKPSDTLKMEIWITDKIEPNDVSWNSKLFLKVNINSLSHPQFELSTAVSFFIDEDKQVVVLFDQDQDLYCNHSTRNVAYIVRVDGSLKEADLGESPYKYRFPHVCSYVPSLVPY